MSELGSFIATMEAKRSLPPLTALRAFEAAARRGSFKLAADEPEAILLVALSGRGDKDVAQAQALLG